MSDANKTDNPYQAPTPSDESLSTPETARPEAKLNPIHWLLPILGYACLPLVILLFFFGPYNDIGPFNSVDVWLLFMAFSCSLLITLPVYAGAIVWLIVLRIGKRPRRVSITLYQVGSIVPPILWLTLSSNFGHSPT